MGDKLLHGEGVMASGAPGSLRERGLSRSCGEKSGSLPGVDLVGSDGKAVSRVVSGWRLLYQS